MEILQYIIHQFSEVGKLQEKYSDKWVSYRDRIYADLMQLRKGDAFRLSTSWKDIPLDCKIGVICLFIMEQAEDNYLFDNKYEFICRK